MSSDCLLAESKANLGAELIDRMRRHRSTVHREPLGGGQGRVSTTRPPQATTRLLNMSTFRASRRL